MSMTHSDICNTSYDQEKNRESNWQFDPRPWKVNNRPDSLACRWRATYRWKALNEGYNFGLDLIPIRGLHKKLWTHKVLEVTTLAISGLPFGSPGKKCHSDATPMGGAEYTILGKVVASPEFGPWWVLWVQGRPWLILAPKVLQLCTNHFMLGLCRSM
jgi:hypothetical protein